MPDTATDLFTGYGHTPLVNDELEMHIRQHVRRLLKHHGIVDGVIEADFTALIKTAISRTGRFTLS